SLKNSHKEATAWFDGLYKANRESKEKIPWARHEVNPLLKGYLENKKPKGDESKRALVIGCGLGDDAKALEDAGYQVVAIDVAQSALDLAQEKFPDSTIRFEKQDIFEMPKEYCEYFDFVFEAFTIQSLPVEFRERMVEAIVNTVAPKGELLVVAHKREKHFDGPPWPLEEIEMAMFQEHGLETLFYEIYQEESAISKNFFNVLYHKPESSCKQLTQ
ncbi:MAG TPA: methyltransferase domain-containing protein, partial [Nitratifractor sp.]|nr:methyltransferase domain-containing protein [Nitratifractor sp.]